MSTSLTDSKEKVVSYLKSVAPFSVVERGIASANAGHVSDCSRVQREIRGIVKEDEQQSQSVVLQVVSPTEIESTCTCCTQEEMQEQWCVHSVALLWRAEELGFLESDSGFPRAEATIRMNTSSPDEIAQVITNLGELDPTLGKDADYAPHVRVLLDCSGDRLGVQVYFDETLQSPVVFDGFTRPSERALDNVLLRMLDDEGSWDDARKLWYVNSSKEIEVVLGLIQEYDDVVDLRTSHPVRFAKEPLHARLRIEWLDAAVQLNMAWVLSDGGLHAKESDLLGTGPYWVVVQTTLYRVSPSASKIASIFPYASTLTVSRSQVAPILEALNTSLFDPKQVEVLNPDAQPEARVKHPTPVVLVERRDSDKEHFSSKPQLELQATLDFEYPTPPSGKNIVYLPDREKEREYLDLLKSLGFEGTANRRRHYISGDAALELLHNSAELFNADWRVEGVEQIRKSLRFVNLAFSINMSESATSAAKGEHKIDWFDCHVSLIQNNANLPISTLFKNARSGEDKWIRLDSGAYAKVPGGGLQQLKTTLGMLDPNFKLSNTIKARLTTAQALSFTQISDEQFEVSLDQRLKKIARKLEHFDSIATIKPSKHFKGNLRPYQQEGLSWLHFLTEMELGGILADEMGLGKTVQTLALLQNYYDERPNAEDRKPALVIAPTSVITNWLYEAKRFAPKLSVLLLHGSQRKRSFAEISKHDIVITSYALLRLDRFDLEKHEFSYVILDEAQNIKNPEAATTKAAKSLRSRNRLALSGTPTENRPLELWSIMDFLMPGYLGSYDFFRTYVERPILESGPAVKVARFLNNKTRPFILRRRKSEVEKDLPPKTESTLYVEMTDSQRQLYAHILEEVRPKIFDAVSKKGVRGASVSILAALLRLRQVCNHPSSIDALKELPGYESGKFNLLKDITQEALESGRKILLFSQFREMLAIIRRWLNDIGVSYLYLDGATKNRQELIDRFNQDEGVRLFLISLKAGGTGLNLTAADTVVIYDPWWNPAVEGQAIDRAHRIGQTKPVQVYRLVTEDSVEKKIMELKARKSKIIDALINSEEGGLSVVNLSKNDLENLFSPFQHDQ